MYAIEFPQPSNCFNASKVSFTLRRRRQRKLKELKIFFFSFRRERVVCNQMRLSHGDGMVVEALDEPRFILLD